MRLLPDATEREALLVEVCGDLLARVHRAQQAMLRIEQDVRAVLDDFQDLAEKQAEVVAEVQAARRKRRPKRTRRLRRER